MKKKKKRTLHESKGHGSEEGIFNFTCLVCFNEGMAWDLNPQF